MATNSNQQQNPIAIFRNDLERMTSQFAMVMPVEVVDRFKRIVVTTLNENPDLLRCTKPSLLQCCMRAAQDGLDLDGREAAIVPFRSGPDMIAQYVPMVLGIRKKVRQTGLVSDWTVHIVYEGDDFDIELGDRPFIRHKPSLKGGRKRPVVGAYSIATFKDGTKSYEFMNLDEITDIQSKSKARSGPWTDPIFFPEMCRKTVARLHAKQLPQSSDLVAMFAREDNENGALPPQQPPPLRINSVTGTLDEFGAGHMPLAAPEDRPPSQEEPPGSQESGPPLDQAAADTADPRGGSDPPLDVGYDKLDPDPIQVAYDRGREQKKKGHTRRAIPPEYRESSATREALAWYAGFDGTSPPTRNQDNAAPPSS